MTPDSSFPPPGARPRQVLSKVPSITLGFWIIKILTTTVGETCADYLAVDAGLGAGLTMGVMAAALIAALTVQMRLRHHVPWIYWLAVVLVSVVGTQITDLLTDRLGVSLQTSTTAFAALLALILAVWHRHEGTLSIAAIDRPAREGFYWATILCTFALGTAAGDLATETLGLGFAWGVVVFGGLLALCWGAWRQGLDAVLVFWVAYILTRPLGAALGDLLTQSRDYGGLGIGALRTSALFLVGIVALVTWSQVNHRIVASVAID